MLRKIKQKIKVPLEKRIYEYLMRNAKYAPGRKLFDSHELRLLTEALVSQNLFGIGGKMVPAFEMEFAKTYGVPYAVAATSGTAALHTAIGALDLNPGDEVITAPITDLGTIIPILYQQCIPVFADIDGTYNMDPQDVEKKITSRTKAIIAVHLFGNPCNMDAMVAVAQKHNIPLIEDCSQAHVTEYKGRYVGTFGDIGCFSFQQAKHMTTGDGGMVITTNKAYYEKMKLFVDKGYARKGWGSRAYIFLGMNYRMNELTAAVGLAQLKKVKDVVKRRNELGTYLTQLLSDIPDLKPAPITPGAVSSYWLYTIGLKNIEIETFAQKMKEQKIILSTGYTGKPIYLCSESLIAKKTFGTSCFPFNAKVTDQIYDYKEGLCPLAENALKHMVCIHLNESWDKLQVEKTAEAIHRCLVSTGLNEKAVELKKEPAFTNTAVEGIKKTRIAIIGCGQMGRWHLDAYKKNPGVELVAFVDTDLKKAQAFIQLAGGKAYASYVEMLKNERIEGVSLCTVPSSHRDIVLCLLDNNVHVLCEKPLAISTKQANEMLTRAEQKKRVLLTGFKFRFFEEVQNAKQILDQNLMGKILSFRLMFGGAINMEGTWYADKAIAGGGIIIDNGPHAFDLIRYLLGEIKTVAASVSTFQNINVEDTAQISCELKNGTKGSINISWTVPIPAKHYLEIYAEEGCVQLYFGGLSYKLKTWDDFKNIPNRGTNKDAFSRQINHFVDAINGKKSSITLNGDGLKAQEIIDSAYASVASID